MIDYVCVKCGQPGSLGAALYTGGATGTRNPLTQDGERLKGPEVVCSGVCHRVESLCNCMERMVEIGEPGVIEGQFTELEDVDSPRTEGADADGRAGNTDERADAEPWSPDDEQVRHTGDEADTAANTRDADARTEVEKKGE